MKAIIFAAGIGSRLGKITEDQPKALLDIGGKALLEIVIRKLIKHGFDEIIINVHHFADQIENFLEENRNFGIRIELSDERDQLLDTGGGLVKASWFFNDDKSFLTFNVDVLTEIDITAFYHYHLQTSALVTLACKNRETNRYFLVDDGNRLCGWHNTATGERIDSRKPEGQLQSLGFSCIAAIQPALFKMIREKGAFSLTQLYLRLAKDHLINVYRHDQDLWMDIGKPDQLKAAKEYFRQRDVNIL